MENEANESLTMSELAQYSFLLKNPVIWAILLVALLCYSLLIELCFVRKRNARWSRKANNWIYPTRVLLSALPLLGLLGTISGLLKTFADMSATGGLDLQQVITGGIAEAMFTTQLGLTLAVPGLIMHSYLCRQKKKWVVAKCHEINN